MPEVALLPMAVESVAFVAVEPVDVELLSVDVVDGELLVVEVELLGVEVLLLELFCMHEDCADELLEEEAARELFVDAALASVDEVVLLLPVWVELSCVEEPVELAVESCVAWLQAAEPVFVCELS